MAFLLEHEKQINEYEETLDRLRSHHKSAKISDNREVSELEKKLFQLKQRVYSELSPWERVTICRHPERPHSSDYIKMICSSFVELYGDRLYRDDAAIIGGLGVIADTKFVIIAQEKGHDTESRIRHNFGMPHPEGYRKAQRLMKLAEKFSLPVSLPHRYSRSPAHSRSRREGTGESHRRQSLRHGETQDPHHRFRDW